MRELEERLAHLEDELKRREGSRLGDMLESLLPGEVREHLRAACREQMLAVSAYLDHMAAKASEAADRSGGETPGRRRIPVE